MSKYSSCLLTRKTVLFIQYFFMPQSTFFCWFVCLFFVFLVSMLLLSLSLEFFSVMPITFIHVIKMDFSSVDHFKSINPFQDMFYVLLFLVDLWKAL